MEPEQAQGDCNGSSCEVACDQQILHIGSSSASDIVRDCRTQNSGPDRSRLCPVPCAQHRQHGLRA